MKQVIRQLIRELNIDQKDLRIYHKDKGRIKRYSENYKNALLSIPKRNKEGKLTKYNRITPKQYEDILTSIVLHDKQLKHYQFNDIKSNVGEIVSKYDLNDNVDKFKRNIYLIPMYIYATSNQDFRDKIITACENAGIVWKNYKKSNAYYEVNLTLQYLTDTNTAKKWQESVWTEIHQASLNNMQSVIFNAVSERLGELNSRKSLQGLQWLEVNGVTMNVQSLKDKPKGKKRKSK